MHREFKKLLKDAIGISQYVIAVNLDVRGFSTFSKKVESPDVAMFIKRVYSKLLDGYFPNASFFKPTGDGLLLMIPYNESNLQANVRQTIDSCLKVTKEFCSFCENDPMVNFETPNKIGIGLSRGTACCLISGDKTLDYSGRVLNLASRLMDVARPSGIVFDAAFGEGLLSEEQAALFAEDQIYVRGLAEIAPIAIWYTKDMTVISSMYKHRLDDIEWEIITKKRTMKTWRAIGATGKWGILELESKPTDPKDIKVRARFPNPNPNLRKEKGLFVLPVSEFEYSTHSGKHFLYIDFSALTRRLEKEGVKNNWEVTIEVAYPKK